MVVVGAGASGIGAAIRLRQAGITDFAVLEKVVGAGRDLAGPGGTTPIPAARATYRLRCIRIRSRRIRAGPVPSPGRQRSRLILREAAREHGVLPHLRCGVEMLRARLGSGASGLVDRDQRRRRIEARVLITSDRVRGTSR